MNWITESITQYIQKMFVRLSVRKLYDRSYGTVSIDEGITSASIFRWHGISPINPLKIRW